MKWPHRYIVVVTAAALAHGKAIFVALGGEAQRPTFAAGLSASGEEPATHYAANTVATELHRQRLDAAEQAGQLPAGLKYFRLDRNGVLQRSNVDAAFGKAGQAYSFEDALSDLGLKQINEAAV